VRRDLALLIHESVTYSEIQDVAFKYGGFLLKDIDLFDVYQGENIEKGKKSYAVSFILQDKEKTLKDKEIDKVMNKLIKGFEKNLGAEIRM
jgi:phenylalanyl-tRNA synthetase beta chain